MVVVLDRNDLEAMVKGYGIGYSAFNNPLVKKAGHSYSDQYGRTDWNSLGSLTEIELLDLISICRKSRL